MIKTQSDYSRFQKAVEDFFAREGVSHLSTVTTADGDSAEPFFSWRRCECCGTTLGGNRYDVVALHDASQEIQEYTICTDCVYYDAYGQLDDDTMHAIAQSAVAEQTGSGE